MSTAPYKGGSSSGQDKSNDNNEIYTLLAVVFGAWLLWMVFGEAIRKILFYLRWVELTPFSFFSKEAAQLQKLSWQSAQAASEVDLANFHMGMSMTGNYIVWLWIAPLLWLAWKVYSKKTFKKQHSMQSLIEQESKLWKEVSPVVELDLISGDLRKGRWRVSETEREFAAHHNLLLPSIEHDSLGVPKPNLNEEKTKEVFIKQLGPVWQGAPALPMYARAVFVCLAMKIYATEQKDLKERFKITDQANQYIGLLAEGYAKKNSTEGMDFSWVDGELEKLENSQYLKNIQRRHAYVFTVFATLLQVVRRLTGVQAAAAFLWLKPVDRTLYYVLNNVGRQDAYHAEACAVMTHWLAEKHYQRALLKPHVDSTLRGLVEALEQFKDDDFEDTIYL